MEILMKVKCSSSPNRNTIKVVDHHHQLQQQHNPTRTTQLHNRHHSHGKHNLTLVPPTTADTMLQNPCLDYATPTTLDCCTAAAQKHGSPCQVIGSNPNECPPYCEYATCCSGRIDYACCAGYSNAAMPPAVTNNPYTTDASYLFNTFTSTEVPQTSYEYKEPEENFVSIDDEKIKAFLQKIGEEQKLKAANKSTTQKPKLTLEEPRQVETHAEVFEIIELDVAKDVEKLQRLRESAEKRVKQKTLNETATTPLAQFFTKTTTKGEQQRKSPNISLVPTTTEAIEQSSKQSIAKSKENIIARIDLLDSDSEVSEYGDENGNLKTANENDDEDEDTTSSKSLNPLLAAAAVSCELGCDNDEPSTEINVNYANSNDEKVYVAASDDEQLQFIDEREEGPELRWDDFEEHSNSRERQIFECHICAKTVQSNYNLRRHMMIHTGERPFGCDLCDRRFREISDLKKHRRRHASQENYFCMICRINPPLETDSTRCGSCDTKNGTLIAAVRPDTVKRPPELEHIFGLTSRFTEKKRSLMSQVIASNKNANNDATNEQAVLHIDLTPSSTPPSTNLAPTTNTKLDEIVLMSDMETSQTIPESTPKEPNSAAVLRALARKRETFKCPLCKRVFGTRHNLKRHFMIHTGEKPYSCPHCRKPFRELSTLKKHMVTHRRDRWYKCMHCSQKYQDYIEYMEHKNTHKEEGIDFESEEGDAGDSRSSRKHGHDDASNDLNDSEDDTMEYDEESLECCECGQRFTDIEQFSVHIKEHEQNRVLYECYICQQLFDVQTDLVEHMNETHQTET